MGDILQQDGEWPFDDANGNNAFGRLFKKFLAKFGSTLLQNDEPLSSVDAAGTGSVPLIKADDSNNTVVSALVDKVISFTVDGTEVVKIDGDAITAPSYLLSDGTELNVGISRTAAGTAYSLTATSAALDFGTTDPSITINRAGTYLILSRVNLKYNAATFAASRTATLKLRRTNNTATDLTNGSTSVATAIITTITALFGVIILPPVLYNTTRTDDVVTIFGDVDVVPSAGSLDATEASIVAIRLF